MPNESGEWIYTYALGFGTALSLLSMAGLVGSDLNYSLLAIAAGGMVALAIVGLSASEDSVEVSPDA